jgi:succinate dehydrogenase/fumarate reductase flavoprotein subunit
VKLVARIGAVVAGAIGMALAGAGTSFAAQPYDVGPDAFSAMSGVSGKTGNTVVDIGNGFSCAKSVEFCINGAVNSGNGSNNGNFVNGNGNANNTGNFTNANGSSNSNNVTHGSSPNGYDNQLTSSR